MQSAYMTSTTVQEHDCNTAQADDGQAGQWQSDASGGDIAFVTGFIIVSRLIRRTGIFAGIDRTSLSVTDGIVFVLRLLVFQ